MSNEGFRQTIDAQETPTEFEERESFSSAHPIENVSPEEKTQKQTKYLYEGAMRYIAEFKVQRMAKLAMASSGWSDRVPQTASLESVVGAYKKKASGRKSIKEKAREFGWKMSGVESNAEVRALVDYIETHVPEHEHKTVRVKKDKAEAMEEKYRSTEVARIAMLLHQPNDPIELLERLKNLKVYLSPYMFKNEKDFEVLKEYITTPGITDFLKRMEVAGITSRHMSVGKGYGFGADSTEQIMATVRDPEKMALFSDKVIARLSEMTKKGLELELDYFDHIQHVAEFVINDKMYNLWSTLNDYQPSGYRRENALVLNLIKIRETGLLEQIMEITGDNAELSSSILGHLEKKDIGEYTDRPEELIEAVKSRINSPEVKQLADDPKLREFIVQASILTDQRIDLENVELWRPLYEHQSKGIAFLEICREAGITIFRGDLQKYPLGEFLQNEQALEVMANPEFTHFVRQFQEQFNRKATIRNRLKSQFFDNLLTIT